jgi:glycosyltransferase involved in cell wall biosynthesis
MSKNIIFVVTSMGRGGAERVISILANHYQFKGYEVSIVMLWHNNVCYELNPSVKVVDMSNDVIKPIRRVPYLVFKLRKYIKKINPYTVVSFVAQNNLIAGMACKGLNCRFIPSERIDPSAVKRNIILKKLLKTIYATSTITVLQTDRARKYFPEVVQRNSIVIVNPIDINTYAIEQSKPRIVSAGRLVKQKNQIMLVKAFKQIHDKYPEYSLTIYGEGELREEIEEQIIKLDLKEAVDLPGNLTNVHDEMKDAYMFVLSSDYEGLSNSLLEAMMMGLPCISTDCSGSDEVIIDRYNGILVPRGNQEQLSEAMKLLIDDKELTKKIGRNAMTSSEKFSTKNVINKWDKIIIGDV